MLSIFCEEVEFKVEKQILENDSKYFKNMFKLQDINIYKSDFSLLITKSYIKHLERDYILIKENKDNEEYVKEMIIMADYFVSPILIRKLKWIFEDSDFFFKRILNTVFELEDENELPENKGTVYCKAGNLMEIISFLSDSCGDDFHKPYMKFIKEFIHDNISEKIVNQLYNSIDFKYLGKKMKKHNIPIEEYELLINSKIMTNKVSNIKLYDKLYNLIKELMENMIDNFSYEDYKLFKKEFLELEEQAI